MRNFKFRGKHFSSVNPEDSYWVHGSTLKQYNTDRSHIVSINSIIVSEDTVGEFTGLYDMNGQEIYEGDILRIPAKSDWEKTNFTAFEVFWHDNDDANKHIGWQMNRLHFQGAICGMDTGLITFLPRYVRQMVVIGNIYDNPELMKR